MEQESVDSSTVNTMVLERSPKWLPWLMFTLGFALAWCVSEIQGLKEQQRRAYAWEESAKLLMIEKGVPDERSGIERPDEPGG